MADQFTISISIKPYLRRFVEINYGLPADFSQDKSLNGLVRRSLRKPNTRNNKALSKNTSLNSESIEVVINQDDFYRYGWEISATDQVAICKEIEGRAKTFMRSIVGVYVSLGRPINISINRFQEKFGFNEDIWSYESIKKDFYRNGCKQQISFESEIYAKIEKIILVNLSDAGTLSSKAIKAYETV